LPGWPSPARTRRRQIRGARRRYRLRPFPLGAREPRRSAAQSALAAASRIAHSSTRTFNHTIIELARTPMSKFISGEHDRNVSRQPAFDANSNAK
jgi:hypothetical protein